MTISMYQASAPRFADMLRNLEAILAKAQAHALARKIDPAVLLAAVEANWTADGAKFWYRNDLAEGKRQFVLVDAAGGKRGPAFDHAKLAAALSERFGRKVSVGTEIGAAEQTANAAASAEREARQKKTEELLQNDPFVQKVMREFGATIMPGSIKPAADAAPR